eukprot:6192320-Pleurochrysis_carterae.AAC.3
MMRLLKPTFGVRKADLVLDATFMGWEMRLCTVHFYACTLCIVPSLNLLSLGPSLYTPQVGKSRGLKKGQKATKARRHSVR